MSLLMMIVMVATHEAPKERKDAEIDGALTLLFIQGHLKLLPHLLALIFSRG